MAVVADTSALVALINKRDAAHGLMRKVFEAETGAVVVPELVIPEVDYLILKHVGRTAEVAFLQDLVDGALLREALLDEDLARGVEIVRRHGDAQVGIVDAATVATCERLGIERIMTLDLWHFRSFRLKGRKAFTILPADA